MEENAVNVDQTYDTGTDVVDTSYANDTDGYSGYEDTGEYDAGYGSDDNIELPSEIGDMPREAQEAFSRSVDSGDYYQEQEAQGQAQAQEPNVQPYTLDDLNSTPVTQWDKNRIPPNLRVADVYDAVSPYIRTLAQQNALYQQAFQALQAQAASAGNSSPSSNGVNNANGVGMAMGPNGEPKLLTDEELDEAATKKAFEKLGLEDDMEFDPYNPKHQLALQRASREVREQNQREVQQYREGVALGQFVGAVQKQPDYPQFNRWLTEELKREGRGPNAIADFLENTRDVRTTMQVVNNYYQRFKQASSGRGNVSNIANAANARNRRQKPLMVESASGSGPDVRNGFNISKFGNMTEDQQADMILKMGLV